MGEYDYIRSFAGIFPKDDPQYIIYIATKKFVGPISRVAELVKNVTEEVAKYKNITETESSLDTSKIITLKNYISSNVDTTKENISSLSLEPVIIGDGNKVINQYPLKGKTVVANTKVFILTNGTNYTMPDVSNWSRSDIIDYCKLIGLDYEINGYGKVTSVSIAPNTQIDLNSKLVINLG